MPANYYVEWIRDNQAWNSLQSQWDCWVNADVGALGLPFHQWNWLDAWWQNYRQSHWHLCVAVVRDGQGALCGLAPWYTDWSLGQGQAIRFLGSGKVCSDFSTIMTRTADREPVLRAVWNALQGEAPHDSAPGWDLLELEGVVEDPTIDALAELMEHEGAKVTRRSLESCWCIDIAPDWEAYIATLDRRYRQKVRSLSRKSLDGGRCELRLTETVSERQGVFELFVAQHQRRRQELGQPGCFASPQFHGFLSDVVRRYPPEQLLLASLTVEGQPAATAMLFLGHETLYLYQSGMEPTLRHEVPGWLLNLSLIRECQRRGWRQLNLMRGDEPYKAHLGAYPQKCYRLRMVPRRPLALFRHQVWEAGAQWRGWLQAGGTGVTTDE